MQIGSAEVGLPEIGLGKVRIAKINFSEISLAKVSSAKISSAKIRMYLWVLFSPCIPSIHPLVREFQDVPGLPFIQSPQRTIKPHPGLLYFVLGLINSKRAAQNIFSAESGSNFSGEKGSN